MPSFEHEALLWLLDQRPEELSELAPTNYPLPPLAGLLPERVSGELSQVVAPARQMDRVYRFYREEDGVKVLALVLVVEMVRSFSRERLHVYPFYQAGVHAQHVCPVEVLLIVFDDDLAQRIPEEIPLDRSGSRLRIHVLRRHHVPEVTDLRLARQRPELAAWSIMAHGRYDVATAVAIARAALFAARHQTGERAKMLNDIVLSSLGSAATQELAKTMSQDALEYQTEFARRILEQGVARGIEQGVARGIEQGVARGIEQGRREGEIRGQLTALQDALRDVLLAKGFVVDDALERRLRSCSSTETLQRWHRRAVVAPSLAEVFAE